MALQVGVAQASDNPLLVSIFYNADFFFGLIAIIGAVKVSIDGSAGLCVIDLCHAGPAKQVVIGFFTSNKGSGGNDNGQYFFHLCGVSSTKIVKK